MFILLYLGISGSLQLIVFVVISNFFFLLVCLAARCRFISLDQRFPTFGSRPHMGSPSIFFGVATGRQSFKKIHAQLHIHIAALVSVTNCALSKFITYIHLYHMVLYTDRMRPEDLVRSFKFCVCCILSPFE
jgi:hypothetical protein